MVDDPSNNNKPKFGATLKDFFEHNISDFTAGMKKDWKSRKEGGVKVLLGNNTVI